MNLNDYIVEYRKAHGLSQRQFAERCGVSNGYISMLEKGINPKTGLPITCSIDMLKKLASGMGTTLNTLFAEVDDMPISLEADAVANSGIRNLIPMPEMRTIPLLGAIACGTPILAKENLDGEVAVPSTVHADFALICKGDSMINARIFDGDVVYIRQQEMVENGEIAAVLIGDEATLKRVRLFPDHIILEPENPTFRPLSYWAEEMNQVRILGKAVAFTSTVR